LETHLLPIDTKAAHQFRAPATYGSMDTGFPNTDAGCGDTEDGSGLLMPAPIMHTHTTITTRMDGTSTTATGRMTITAITIGTTTLTTENS